jgi:hypothetical protein
MNSPIIGFFAAIDYRKSNRLLLQIHRVSSAHQTGVNLRFDAMVVRTLPSGKEARAPRRGSWG